MRRMHLFEFEDQPWLPDWVRDALTDHLAELFRSPAVSPLHLVVADRLEAVLKQAGTTRIVDLCAGAGGPWPSVLPLLEARLGSAVTLTLTDRYPRASLTGIEAAVLHRIELEARSVDARMVPKDLDGVCTVFNSIHHFRPDGVASVLRSATAGGRSLAIFEPFERRPRLAARLAWGGLRDGWRQARRRPGPLVPAVALLMLLPMVLAWDGAASVLRGYRAEELEAIASDAVPDFAWLAERVALPWGGMNMLIGQPDTILQAHDRK